MGTSRLSRIATIMADHYLTARYRYIAITDNYALPLIPVIIYRVSRDSVDSPGISIERELDPILDNVRAIATSIFIPWIHVRVPHWEIDFSSGKKNLMPQIFSLFNIVFQLSIIPLISPRCIIVPRKK